MGYQPEKNHPVCLVLWFQKKLTSGPRLQRAFNYGQETNIRCFSRRQYWCELHAPGGVVAKKRQMMKRGRGGVTIPPKIDDVIYEQALTQCFFLVFCISFDIPPKPLASF